MSHQCPVGVCDQNLPSHLLMCRPHWFMVPRMERSAVWAAYDGGFGIGTPELLEAQHAAIQAVNHKLGKD